MTMQLAFEHVSTDADRLSFQERSCRMSSATRGGQPALPHVDDLLFAIALVGLSLLAGAELREGVGYALGNAPAAVAITGAPGAQLPG